MLFATGAEITLNGAVTGDALPVSETIFACATAVIGGNLFIAGANLTVNWQVTGSVFGGTSDLIGLFF